RAIMSSVIFGSSVSGWCQQPDPTGESQMTTRRAFCGPLHHSLGHDLGGPAGLLGSFVVGPFDSDAGKMGLSH
ncbi:MAG: hypothetical protein ACRC67_36695, partial [Inquilinus sp.]|uniref:hypothetical protein n=1 Tax=Inquilinus sp. TaxID=1932117 RepID=UPI003F2E993F